MSRIGRHRARPEIDKAERSSECADPRSVLAVKAQSKVTARTARPQRRKQSGDSGNKDQSAPGKAKVHAQFIAGAKAGVDAIASAGEHAETQPGALLLGGSN